MPILTFLQPILGGLKPIFQGTIKALLSRRPVAFGISVALFLTSFGLGYESWTRADFYERTVERSLAKRTENTPQRYKALEALILANTETDDNGDDFSFATLIGNSKISDGFEHLLHDVQNTISGPAVKTAASFTIAKPDIASLTPARQAEAIITESGDPGFLFLPVRLLRIQDDKYKEMLDPATGAKMIEEQVGITTSKEGPVCASSASPICDDVLLTRALLATLKAFTNLPVTKDSIGHGIELSPTQAYVITENGVLRIVNKNGNDAVVYRNQFRASTVFPSRPYYIGAFKKAAVGPEPLFPSPNERWVGALQDYFYISDPYLDIGGNGIIVTLSRAFKYNGHSEGVICFDLKISDDQSLGAKLETLLDRIGGTHPRGTCTIKGNGDPDCRSDSGQSLGKWTSAFTDLEGMLKSARDNGNLSEVIGSIAFRDKQRQADQTTTAAFQNPLPAQVMHADSELRFTVPLGPPKVTDLSAPVIELRFMAVTLNVGRYLQYTAILGYLALISLGLSLSIAAMAWAFDATKRWALHKEKLHLHKALDNVSQVMLSVKAPYVRLDSTDHIIDANQSFAKFLGLSGNLESLKSLKGTRFEDWIDESSIAEYHRVLDSRKAGEAVAPYDLNFKGKNTRPPTRKAKIVGSIVPASQDKPGGLPETFGILIPAETAMPASFSSKPISSKPTS